MDAADSLHSWLIHMFGRGMKTKTYPRPNIWRCASAHRAFYRRSTGEIENE